MLSSSLELEVKNLERAFPALRGRIVEKLGSQAALAKRLGISEHTLSEKLNGRADWKLKEIKEAAHVLSIPAESIAAYFF